MPEAPVFFLPGTSPETAEERYAQIADTCRRPVPPMDERIYSIIWRHDGVEWTVTVGQRLQGTERRTVGRGARRTEQQIPHSDEATVLAIFAGVPYTVFTDGYRTRWANPFLAGDPSFVQHFAAPKTRIAGSGDPQ